MTHQIVSRKTTEANVNVALIQGGGKSFYIVEQVNGAWVKMTTELSEEVARRMYDGMAEAKPVAAVKTYVEYAVYDLTTQAVAKHPRQNYELIFSTENMADSMLDVFRRSPRYQVRPI